MKSMVVLFALAAVACGTYIPAQPAHHPAIVLDPHGRPLDTAEVIASRAVHLQAKALEGYGTVIAPITPIGYSTWGAHAGSILGHGVWKRSLGLALGHVSPLAYSVPVSVAVSPAQSSYSAHSVDIVHPSPVHTVVAPVLAHSTWGHGLSHLLKKRSLVPISYAHSPIVYAQTIPAAVSHQSRIDVHSTPAVVSHSVLTAPVLSGHSFYPSLGLAHGLGHLLKKRSLGLSYGISPVAIAHSIPALSHQSRVDVISSPALVSPIAHSAVWTVPASHWTHSGLLNTPLAHAW